MREIKFRAYDKENKIMFYEFEQNDVFIAKMQDKEDWRHLILMQYTGLKDKNGKDIYEGDIVRIDILNQLDQQFNTHESFVVFEYGMFMVDKWRCSLQEAIEREDSKNGVEVIGNIFENKELYAKL